MIGANGMKIWVIGRNYPDQSNNGQGSFELEQAKMLAKRGNDVTYIACVLHPFWRIKNGGFVEFDDAPVKVIAYSGFFTPHMNDPMIQFPYFPKLRHRKWKVLLKHIEKEKGLPDVIHIHFPLMVLAADVFEEYKHYGVKIVVTEHWSKVLKNRLDSYEKSQMDRYLSVADTYISVGYTLKDAIVKISGTDRKIEVLPNIINDVFHMRNEFHRGFNFGMVGRLSIEKQVDKVIEVFASLFKGQLDTRLIIVGDGRERKKLENLARRLGVKQQVEFTGILSRAETAKRVNTFNCLVSFSKYETFCVPAIEAWASGVPIISTTANSILEEWDNRLGISLASSNVNELKEAMLAVHNNSLKYKKKYISDFANAHYSEGNVCQRLIKLYKQ